MSTTRRHFIGAAALGGLSMAVKPIIRSAAIAGTAERSGPPRASASDSMSKAEDRFPCFQSRPVSYLRVKMQDTFWAPRLAGGRGVRGHRDLRHPGETPRA